MQDQIQARQTVFALSSGALPSGVAVIRLSGPSTPAVVASLVGSLPPPRQARLAIFRNKDGMVLDKGLCLFFPAPASFTGEDCAELHVHGGRAVVAAILDTLSAFPGLHQAEAGEFTKRAFLNGKIDLTGAEALSDLIAAETETQRRFAVANSTEQHRVLYEGWRRQLLQARAMIEAELDFADESDVPEDAGAAVWSEVESLRQAVASHAQSYRDAEIIREGLRVVILGAPNAGKSSLLNALARRDVAIVTEEPGTTRDVLEVDLDLNGMKVVLMDTAGIREAAGSIEVIGIERALERAEAADLVIALEDVAHPAPVDRLPDKPIIRVGSKGDLLPPSGMTKQYDCVISTITRAGLEDLLGRLHEMCEQYRDRVSDILPFRARHVALLNEAVAALDWFLSRRADGLELRAESLRIASDALGRICGAIDVEDMLDTIFSTFCIGK